TFRKELEKILKDPALSQELRDEMSALAPKYRACGCGRTDMSPCR
ncbi:TPA: hypothetical protein ACK0K3_004154, partial [Enterobacter hormaechei]